MGSFRKSVLDSRPLTDREKELMSKDGVALVRTYVYSRFPNESVETKEDLVAEGLMCVCERMKTFDPSKSAFSSHVYRILGFDLRNYYNTNKFLHRTEMSPLQFEDDNRTLDETMDALYALSEKHGLVGKSCESSSSVSPIDLKEALGALTELEREVVTMFSVLDMTIGEIAEKLNLKPKEVYYTKNRALEKLREEMPAKVMREVQKFGWR